MNNLLEFTLKIVRLFGVNRAISLSVMARAWGLIAGVVNMALIATLLSGEEQGFYFTINSLLSLQIFFELGLTGVIATFVSHEFASLSWGKRGSIGGELIAVARFEGLLRTSARWFGWASFLLLVLLVPAGLFFFGQGDAGRGIGWRIPWILAVTVTALNLFVTPYYAAIMGSGEVVTVNRRELAGAVVGSLLGWSVLGLRGGLYAVSAIAFGNALISWGYLLLHKPDLVRLAWSTSPGSVAAERCISWRDEVWPMQWKIALTWMCGYFVFQLFNPVLFHYHGALAAGQMGMTLSASNALLAVSLAWFYAQAPEFGKLVARGEWKTLDRDFFRILAQAATVAVMGAVAGWGAIALLQARTSIGERFISASSAAMLFATVCVQVTISGLGVYLRSHKQEPFWVLALFLGVLHGTTTWLFGKWYAAWGVVGAYFTITLCVALPASLIIWWRCRRLWHSRG